jgi:hypothetical protein
MQINSLGAEDMTRQQEARAFPVAGKAATLRPSNAIQTHNGILGYPTPAVCAEYPASEVPIHGLVYSAVLYIVMHGNVSTVG